MAEPKRNDPCPCGSGKKYKRCCLERDRKAHATPASHRATQRALEWLDHKYGSAVSRAVTRGFLGSLGTDLPRVFDEVPLSLKEVFWINSAEWLLAEGAIDVGGVSRRVADLLLGPRGPLFAAEERSYLEVLCGRPMRLYEVLASRPGDGLTLRDVMARDAPATQVQERLGSESLVRGDLIAGRLIQLDGVCQLSGALYPFSREKLAELRRGLIEVVAPDATQSSVVIPLWLDLVTRLQEPPTVVDARSGDPILLVTDVYRILDPEGLATALAAEPEVEGDPETGWARLEASGEGPKRSLLSLNPKPGGRLEVFTRTLALADEGRSWLEKLAGAAVAWQHRDTLDPRSPPSSREGRVREEPGESTALTTEMVEKVYHHTYRRWADEPIPALGGKTPREAVRSPRGREEVAELLRTYENGEHRRAREERREPANFSFLWEAVGLEPGTDP